MNTAVLKLRGVIDLSESNATENDMQLKGRNETCVYIMSNSTGIACMIRLPSLRRKRSQSKAETSGVMRGLQASWKALPLF